MSDQLVIAGTVFSSRLFSGTGKFASGKVMQAALAASGCSMVTVALKRMDLQGQKDAILPFLDASRYRLLPNTSGVRNAKEAVLAAQLAREALDTPWVKLEIHPDPKYLLPDPIETLEAARILVQEGFIVLPYINADPVLCKRLEDVGVQAVMPLGAPIGTNRGLETRAMLEIIIAQSNVPVIIDAGIGAPSHAAAALEMGADAVLVNTAIAIAPDPVAMARAFALAVEAGSIARKSGLPAVISDATLPAQASSPFTEFLTSL
jgi:thiazole synthase